MQLSRFVLTWRDVRPDEHVLYDVVTDRYLGVDGRTLDAIARWREAPPAEGTEEAEAARVLAGEGFLVAGRAEDDARLGGAFAKNAEGMPGTLYVTLMPTLACNLACTYCFQKDHPAFTKMSAGTEAQTVAWILGKVDEARTPRLLVSFFGGEPLTRKESVLESARAFAEGMAARGGEFEWEMITNGVELDVATARALAACGPGTVKVTLDGDKETHDAARVYRDGRGSFDRILANLLAVAREVPELRLRVGGNFRAGQVASYERLVDRLEAEGLRGRLADLTFKPIVDVASSLADSTCTSCVATPQRNAEALVQLGRKVQRSGLAPTRIGPLDRAGACELHWKNSYVIDPEGRVYRCPAVAGRPELAIGHVSEAAVGPDPLTRRAPWRMCGDCAFLPVCVGGCIGGTYLQTGEMDVMCRLPELQRTYRETVVQRYLDEFPTQELEAAQAA